MKKVLLFFLMQSHTKPEKHTYFQVSKQKRKHALSLRVILENLFLKLSSKVLSTRNAGRRQRSFSSSVKNQWRMRTPSSPPESTSSTPLHGLFPAVRPTAGCVFQYDRAHT